MSHAFIPVAVVCLLSAAATASPEVTMQHTLAEELRGTADLFCTTSLAVDLWPIVTRERRLAIAKMSEEGMREEHELLAETWRAAAAAHRRAIDGVPLTIRAVDPDEDALRAAANTAWRAVTRRCGAQAKRFAALEIDAEVVAAFYRYRQRELRNGR
jgi:hypothetical protein